MQVFVTPNFAIWCFVWGFVFGTLLTALTAYRLTERKKSVAGSEKSKTNTQSSAKS